MEASRNFFRGASRKQPIEPEDVGMQESVKNLWQAKPKPGYGLMWVEKKPNIKAAPEEMPQHKKHAIVVRHMICRTGKKAFSLHSVIVQSPLIKDVLKEVLQGYPGVTTSLDDLTFETPFAPLVHRWDMFSASVKDQKGLARTHMQLLYNAVKEDLGDLIAKRDNMLKNGVITFNYLWTIFKPGDLIFATVDSRERIFKLVGGHYSVDSYLLTVQYVDWDGVAFGIGHENISVHSFTGTREIVKLDVYPVDFHEDKLGLTQRILERSRKFESLRGCHYKAYDGISLESGPFGDRKHIASGRIIVDAESYGTFESGKDRALTPLEAGPSTARASGTAPNKKGKGKITMRRNSSDSTLDLPPALAPTFLDPEIGEHESQYLRTQMFSQQTQMVQQQTALTGGTLNLSSQQSKSTANIPALTEDQLLICTTLVRGYSLKTKKWGKFYVDQVVDIKWDDHAFESLVLPKDHKELILTFVESQVMYKEAFDDVIQGKGKGIIMLLSGPPGVGKTLTAESVAEHMRAPLYSIAAGELGLESAQVETKLSNILKMAMKWNAVVLLDEADVFLEARALHELERNKLVAVFLRMLEYYEGTLFLTTNRVKGFDPAFASRIHISIDYPDLSQVARRSVWVNFLTQTIRNAQVRSHEVTAKELDKLSEQEMNGRQIKNVVKTAQLLACRLGVPLRAEHIWKVLSISDKSTAA